MRTMSLHGNDIENRALGGTESTLLYIARYLALCGYNVTVAMECPEAHTVQGVRFIPVSLFEAFAESENIDVFIGVRHLLPLRAKRWAPLQIFWTGDAYDQQYLKKSYDVTIEYMNRKIEPCLYSIGEVLDHIDLIFCVGNWQAQTFVSEYNLDPSRIRVMPNVAEIPDRSLLPSWEEREPALIYTSTPFRGLEYLLSYFDEMKIREPSIKLFALSGLELYGQSSDDNIKMFPAIYGKQQADGVTLLKPLKKREMADYLLKSRVFAYPNIFRETFCIAALEAQAYGVPGVVGAQGALPERYPRGSGGALVFGQPMNRDYRDRFIQECIRMVFDKDYWMLKSTESRELAEEFSVSKVGDKWKSIIQEFLKPIESFKPELWIPDNYPLRIKQRDDTVIFNLKFADMRASYCQSLRYIGLSKTADDIDRLM
jgi:glycosyltransferase involved in cell wall biosynthesis